MARRRKSRFGEVKLRSRGAKRERLQTRLGLTAAKRVGIKVFVARGDMRGGGEGIPAYHAWACPVSSRASTRRRDHCGPTAFGRTPTRAVEAALVALAKSHALRAGGR